MAEFPRLLGRYEVQEEIGRGMMGVVYRGRDPMLGRIVALKTVSLRFAAADEDGASFERRFLTEARAAALLSHPSIVTVHDVGRDTGTDTLYIALEYLEGRTLLEVVRDQGALPWPTALRIMGRLASALDHAHRRGIIHRDVKPANVMILPSGEPKLMDFGLARFAAAEFTAPGQFFGTPCYMSPEQASGETTLDGRTDLFSLGSVAYLMLTGRRAFDAPSVPGILTQVVSQPPPPLAPDIPEDVAYVVARCLAKQPDHRYAQATLLAEDIEDVLAGSAPRHRATWASPAGDSTRPEPRPPVAPTAIRDPVPTSISRLGNPWLGLLGVLAVAALLVWLGALLAPRPESERPVAPAVAASAPSTPAAPARLEVTFTHPFRRGTVRVFVDDRLVLGETVEGAVTRNLLAVKLRRGSYAAVRDVAAGERTLRVVVEDEGGFRASRRIRGTFASGRMRRLVVEVSGVVRKDLSVRWGSP